MDLAELLALCADFVEIVESTSLTMEDITMILSIPFTEYDIINNHIPDREKDKNVQSIRDEHDEAVWTFNKKKAGKRLNNIIYKKQPVDE